MPVRPRPRAPTTASAVREKRDTSAAPVVLVSQSLATLEHERTVALVRAVLGPLLWAYAYFALGSRPTPLHFWASLVLFSGAAIAFIVLARAATASSLVRAVTGSLTDIAAASYLMVLAGETGAVLVTVYAITCLDTGLQHGRTGLVATSLAALLGFVVVWGFTEFWQTHLSVALAMVAGFLGAVTITGLNMNSATSTRSTGTEDMVTHPKTIEAAARAPRAESPTPAFSAERMDDTGVSGMRRRSPTRQKILVVDDNATNRIIAEAILNAAGHDTDAVDNAQSALERLVSGHYHLAVVDMHMPDMGGVALLRRYRNMAPTARIPIVVLTANATAEAAQEAADAGADGFLTKPVSARSLVTTVEKLLADNEARASQRAITGAGEGSAPTRVVDAAVVRELQRVCGSPEEFANLASAFKDESGALVEKFAHAIESGDLPAGTDCALA